MQNEDVIQKFYSSFAAQDAEAMVACYHTDVVFQDPAFGKLYGDEARDMWRMLIQRAEGNLHIVLSEVNAVGDEGSAHWQATYNYGKSQRKVVNEIDASFTFKDGLIIEHVDTFDIWKWSRMALGMPGVLLGWSSFLQNKIRGGAKKSLKQWRASKG